MHDILVNTVNFESWSRDAQYGTRLAALLQAAVTGVFVYPSPFYTAPSVMTPELTEAVLETARVLEASALAAEKPFIAWANGMGVEQASWVVAQGNLSDTLVRIACWHDLLVLERDADRTWSTPADLAELILAVGVPCIVVPPQPVRTVSLSRIAIAWNGAPEAIRAVHSALPLLQRANEVLLLRGASRGILEDVAWKPPFDIDAYLDRHGIHPRSQDLVDTAHGIGAALLEQAEAFHADLLVMGAYGRSRFSEWALGGATRHVLWNARLPVLFRH
jgi:nucleotide-binding universal stress UspA family protein